jgi:undecaprenyl phosphate-alpha-L-ara4N flippase subunit ArnE
MPFYENGAARISYEVAGSGPPLWVELGTLLFRRNGALQCGRGVTAGHAWLAPTIRFAPVWGCGHSQERVSTWARFGNFRCAQADMTLELLTLIMVSVACDVFGQTFFKLAAIGIGAGKPRIVPSLWVAIGLLVYVIEIFVWLGVLAIAPLTVAAPIASLNYIGVILVGRWLFSERITRRQWAGAGLVTLGVIAVALTEG